MECRDVREIADSYVAQGLPADVDHDVLRHLETCPACRADLAARRALGERVRRAFREARDLDPTPEFTMRLRAALRAAARHAAARRGRGYHG